jgi:hypothetical protein
MRCFRNLCSECRDDNRLLLTFQYIRAAARCKNLTLVAGEPRFLGTSRRRYLPELLPAIVPMMSPSPRAYAEAFPNIGTGSSGDARPASRFALQMPTKKWKVQSKSCLFRDEHGRTHGLKVTSRLARSGQADSVQCRFCVEFGREAKEAANCGGELISSLHICFAQTTISLTCTQLTPRGESDYSLIKFKFEKNEVR